jgi:hypothetical protein
MKLLQISLSILLIPALVAGPPDLLQLSRSAKALLKKPRLGTSEITWRDGTHARAEIVRVTDRFVTVKQGGNQTCENVELSRIAKVDWEPSGGGISDLGGEVIGSVLFAAASIPFLLVYIPVSLANHEITGREAAEALLLVPVIPLFLLWYPIGETKQAIVSHRVSHEPKLGSWQSSSAHSVERIKLTNAPKNQFQIEEQLAAVRTGQYRFEESKLHLRYDDDRDPEIAVGAGFECNRLVTDDPKRLPTLYVQKAEGSAQPPIVGRWSGGYGGPGPNTWEFHADGTFQAEKVQRRFAGSLGKTKDAVATVSGGAKKEEWKIALAGESLLITRDGKTTEFKRRTPFD